MRAIEYLEALVRNHPGVALSDVLAADPVLLDRIRVLPVAFSWTAGSADGWYLLKRGERWDFHWQERGAALHGETFESLAAAIAWGFEQRLI